MQQTELVNFLDYFFTVEQFAEASQGIYHASDRAIQRLGLALEPSPQLAQWVVSQRIDGLFLHRPWKLDLAQFPADVGIVSYHLAFDQTLTLSFNPPLAIALTLANLEPFGEKQGRTIGMIGTIPPQSFEDYQQQVKAVFSGVEQIHSPASSEITHVAVVGAMTDALVREAVDRGVHLYITGQLRQPANLAVVETGIGVIAVGHTRSEQWGLRSLAGVLQERWATLETVIMK